MYTADQFQLRLKRLQRLCSTLSVDGLLFIGGVDGCDNLGSARCISYLFSGG